MKQENPSAPYIPAHAKKVFQGKIFTVWQWEQKLFDGSTKTFEMIARPDAAYVLPVLEDTSLLLVIDEQPHREPVITLPRGRVEPGETAAQGAERELLEETGYKVRELVPWHAYRPWGKVSWTIHMFIGHGAYAAGAPQNEAGEKITLRPTSFEEFIELGITGKLQDPILQIMTLQARLDPEKMKSLRQLLYGSD